MPNPELAARIRTEILTRPHHYNPTAWLGGITLLDPDTAPHDADPLCRTTLCVAGYAAHFTGHTLEVINDPSDSHGSRATQTFAYKPGSEPLPVWVVAQRVLDLTDIDAGWLFAACTKASTALAALGQLADGVPRIDWDAIPQ
ncbi:hypothetical protein ACFYY1_39175 [Streptomyces sp. NPDC001890]|uniref:hypothetical protein n=1 Tax=Streptomyces sp. NPDC001890 TaxID=3364620 RepID=UPI0036ABC112